MKIVDLFFTRFNECLSNIKGKFNKENIIENYSVLLKTFLGLLIIFLIAITSIIRANFNYVDDQGRVAEGYKEWNYYSRYASSFLSTFIHADNYLTDISPLTQFIAIALMAMAGAIVVDVYKDEKKFSMWDVIALIPFGLSPYFLSCISYKYDSPYMALSVFVSVLPLLFRNKKIIVYSIVTVFCTLIMCMTYQASSGIFIMLVFLICLKEWNNRKNNKRNIKFLIISLVNYILGLLIFKLFIMNPVDDGRVSSFILPINNLLPGGFENLKQYFSSVFSDFKIEWIVFVILIAVSFVYVFVRYSKQKKKYAFFVTTVILLIMLFSSFGLYPILTKPLISCRAMYGFGVFISFMAIAISTSPKVYISKIIVFCLSWCFFAFSFTYGNALEVQDKYTDFRVNLIIQDLNDLEIFTTNTKKKVQISGTIGQAPVLKNMSKEFKILKKLVPIQLRQNWYWGSYYFYNYFGLKNVKANFIVDLNEDDLPILKDTMYHTIRGNDKNVLIVLK